MSEEAMDDDSKEEGVEPAESAAPPIEGWVENLRDYFAAANEPLPDRIASKQPFVYVDLPPDDFARRCVEVMRGRNLLFRRGRSLGTVDEAGDFEEMTADRFRTWLPAVAGVVPFKETIKSTGEPRKTGIPYELARAVLASDELRLKSPEIEAVNLVRLPVFRSELDERGEEGRKGFRKMELLPLGYDAPTKTYTVHQGPSYDEELDPHEGRLWLGNLFQYFAFSDPERLAVQIAAMLTVFGRGLFNGRSPMFMWNSNLEGSGKSRLSQVVLEPIFGNPGKSGYSFDSREEVRKELDATAQEFSRYIWFDDVPKGTIKSTDLNRWLTAKTWKCRILGTKNVFNGPIYAATLMTGAQLEMDSMIARRTLVIDLFPKQRSRNRHLPDDAIPINDDFFEDEGMMNLVLASLWGLFRWWDENGRPGMKACGDLEGESPLESFESWSGVIPPVVATCGFGNCLKRFEAPDAGDTEARDFASLAEVLIRENAVGRDSATVTMEQVVSAARRNGLFIDHLGSLEDVIRDLDRSKTWKWKIPDDIPGVKGDDGFPDPEKEAVAIAEIKREQAAGWTDKRLQSSWGKRFRRSAVSGQYFTVDGVVWEFGTRESSRKAAFPITKVSE